MLLAVVMMSQSGRPVVLKPNQTITKSCVVAKRIFDFPNGEESGIRGGITIRGNNITVDFNGATLRGTPDSTAPNRRKGTGILVQGRNITIRNLKVRGYKIGLTAFDSPGLRILDSDFSYNWKQNLLSTLDREDLADWMSFHKNERDEWLRYGAAIYLRRCDGFEVRGCKAMGGQCGLMLMQCNKGHVWNNNLSFLSAIGLGMYRSSQNKVFHNKIDWCVRGYSHGVYNRGQDSAGILVYEQSNANVFAYNSVTHGGDGFFLWAGQSTMDTGAGGCNGNLVYGNDFSHAPTNGIEATFSRNMFVNNKIDECWHGFWTGYSYESLILGNFITHCDDGIAWEHGQKNRIVGNYFDGNRTAIRLWKNPSQDPNWGYPRHRDTDSHDYQILDNGIDGKTGVLLRDTRDVIIRNNRLEATTAVDADLELEGLQVHGNVIRGLMSVLPGTASDNLWLNEKILKQFPIWRPRLKNWDKAKDNYAINSIKEIVKHEPDPLSGGINAFLPEGSLRGRKYILVDHWGPYDFRSPLLWPRRELQPPKELFTVGMDHIVFDVLGPRGRWKLIGASGCELSAKTGRVPGTVVARMPKGQAKGIKISLEYTGGEVTDYRGVVTQRGKPVKFGYTKFHCPIDWNVRFYSWNPALVKDPKANMPPFSEMVPPSMIFSPVHVWSTSNLDLASAGSPLTGVPPDHFLTSAEGEFEIEKGEYEINVTSDDGVRVWVDGKKIIDAWKWQGPTAYSADLDLSGRHKIRVEHYEIDGYMTLKVAIRPKQK